MSDNEAPLRSRRPYLLRAMHEWITDIGQTPLIVVDAAMTGVEAPLRFAQNGKLILNVSHSAANGLTLGNDVVRFRARFGGVTQEVIVPVAAVLGIYARETGQGMIFSEDDKGPPTPTPAPSPPSAPDAPPKRSHLKIVK